MYSGFLRTLKSWAWAAFSVSIMSVGVGKGSIRKQHFQQKEALKGFYVKLLVLGGISFSVVFIDSPLMGDGEACWDWKSFSLIWLSPRSLWAEWCFKEEFLSMHTRCAMWSLRVAGVCELFVYELGTAHVKLWCFLPQWAWNVAVLWNVFPWTSVENVLLRFFPFKAELTGCKLRSLFFLHLLLLWDVFIQFGNDLKC